VGSGSSRSRFFFASLLSIAWLSVAGVGRAELPSPPPFYAVENVRVAIGNGEVIDGATVLVSEGLIENVGVGLEVPADAWRVDGTDLLLLPGLIDSMTDFGLGGGGDGSSGTGGGPGSRGPVVMGPEDRPLTTPWVRAAEAVSDERRAEKWREIGFTSVVTAPSKGIFPGQAAFLNLSEGEPEEQIVEASVAQRIQLETSGGFRSYPSSLMGILSYVEQVFADVDHYEANNRRYDESALGRERPAFDRALAPLAASRSSRQPFIIPGQPGRELDRALTLIDRIGVQGILYGAHGAYERLDALAQAGVPVIVSLDWPEEGNDRDPDADTPYPELYHRHMSPKVPGLLAGRGLPFSFSSAGISSGSDVQTAIRTAVENGLSDASALKALTMDAAALFGLDDRLGTVERGKIANLVLATDYPWVEGAEVRTVFVDGHKYEVAEEEEPGEEPSSDVSGTWQITMQSPGGAAEMTAELEMSEDGDVEGEISSERGTTAIDDGKMSGDLLRFETTREMGGREVTGSWSLTVEGEALEGSMSAGPMSMDVMGERTAANEKSDESDEEDEPEVSAEELAEVMALYRGPVRTMTSYAITNATVWTGLSEPIENGVVVVEDGRITAVGDEVVVPDGVETIDAEGGALIPGIIDAHSHIAIEGGVNEGTLAVTAIVAIGDVINPDDIGIYRALAGGVTTVNLLHGSANPIGGQNAVAKLRWGMDAEGMKFEGSTPGIKFALGENPKRSNFSNPAIPSRYPQTRMGVMDVIREAFIEAERYRSDWQAYESALESAKGKRRGRSAEPPPEAPRRDLKLETLVEILEGERLVHSHSYRADEILQLLRLAEEFGFRIGTLQHVLEGYKIADEIAEHGAGASTFSDWWGYKVEAYDAIPHNAALMIERGVVVSINSDSGEEMRHLNQEAAKAVKWGGLSPVEALKLVTLNPAIQLGIDDRVGSIEVGKEADLVLYDGDPLSSRSVVQRTFVDGDLYFDRTADAMRQARINEIKVRLLGEDESDDAESPDSDTSGAETPGAEDPEPSRESGAYWTTIETYSCREAN